MAGSGKKVIVRTTDGAVLPGYLPASGLVGSTAATIELLETAGRIVPLRLEMIRYVAYVRDFNLNDSENPERLLRRTFLARPRTEGLWIRVTFKDGEMLEGLAPLDLAWLDDAMEDKGVFLLPPDVRSNTQRLYIPRTSLSGMRVVAVITTPSKSAAKGRDQGETLPFPD